MNEKASDMTSPFFLVAARRSGTTLLRLMLKGHPDVLFDHGWEDVAKAISNPPSGSPRMFEFKGIAPFSADSAETLSASLRGGVDAALHDAGKTRFGATCHVGFLQLGKTWPDARYVHLIRDPRDVAISSLKLGWSGHPYFSSETWRKAESDWDRLKEELSEDRICELRYEALVTDPRAELTRLCAFLGLPYDEALFSYVETSTYSFPKAELAERWRRSLSPAHVDFIEARIRPLMAARGYPPEGEGARIGAFARRRFRLVDFVSRKRRRLSEVGFVELAAGKIGRLTGSKRILAWQEKREDRRRSEKIARLERNY